MLVGVIAEQSFQNVQHVISKHQDTVDVLELRLDVLSAAASCSLESFVSQVKSLLDYIRKPVIFTYRPETRLEVKEKSDERLEVIYKLCELNPDYIDLEDYILDDFVNKVKEDFPKVKIIRSYHNYENWNYTQAEQVLAKMQQAPAAIYKIIGTAESSLDSLSVLDFVTEQKKISPVINITAHCMGDKGNASRVLGVVSGNYFTYVNLSKTSIAAPGILNIDELLNIYNYKKINSITRIYALIGSPVEQSIGHIYHNKKFKDNNIDAIYVKIDVSKHELAEFWGMVKTSKLDFRGFSVTMPLKNCIAGLLGMAENKSPYNTIKLENNKILLANTDGEAVLDVLADDESDNKANKRLCLLGTGGTAQAIILAAAQRGYEVIVIGRNKQKLDDIRNISNIKNITTYLFDDINKLINNRIQFDYIISALPMDVDTVTVQKKEVLLEDIVKRLSFNNRLYKTKFLDVNYTKNNNSDGLKMFERQAELQYDFWMTGETNGK